MIHAIREAAICRTCGEAGVHGDVDHCLTALRATRAQLMDRWLVERKEANDAVANAERQLAVAQRAKILLEAGMRTGEMVIALPGNGRVRKNFSGPSSVTFSEAWRLASLYTR